jgi:PIN domain nuclease of toxin-antitoxin system
MKLLLDTHALLWWLDDPSLLSKQSYLQISDPNVEVLVSAAVIWEIAIKQSLGKLVVVGDVDMCITKSNFKRIEINFEHCWAVKGLPFIHRDPFDRMLIAQALVEKATIATRDPNFPPYGVPCVLA